MISSEEAVIKYLDADSWPTEQLHRAVLAPADGTQAPVTPPLTPHSVGAFHRRPLPCTHPTLVGRPSSGIKNGFKS